MADRKISDLTALTTPASGDYLPIVDISEAAAASKNKRITIEELMRGVPDGTAAAPSIAFETDPNTGIYSPGADQLAVATNGVGRLYIDASGNVGVGTSSPDAALTVVGTGKFTATQSLLVNGTSGTYSTWQYNGTAVGDIGTGNQVFSGGANTDFAITARSTTSLVFGTNTTERLRITSAGLVGIGNSSPAQTLDVSGTVNFKPAAGYNSLFQQSGTSLRINYLNDAGSANVSAAYRATSYEWQKGDGAPVVNIDSSGRLGIGSTSPGDILHVKSANPIVIIEATGTYGGITLSNSGGAANTSYLLNTNAGVLTFRSNAITFNSYDGVTERIRIDTSGRLLVGTSSNSGGALFQVNGDRIRVGTAKTPATSGATGTTGEIAWDANYIYVCTATDTWKRSAIATW